MQLKYITRNNTLPERKKNLFFCCHPEDFKIYFDSISTDILKILDCTVWYSDSPDRKLSEDELSCFDLFVIPVTRKLLMTPNCAIDYEFRYALSKNKAILLFITVSSWLRLASVCSSVVVICWIRRLRDCLTARSSFQHSISVLFYFPWSAEWYSSRKGF